MQTPDAKQSPKLARWLALAAECRALAGKLMAEVGPPSRAAFSLDHLLRLVVLLLAAKACDTFDALVLLCRSGWGVEASVLLRVLLETAANAAFVTAVPEPGLFLYAESTDKAARDYLTAIQWAERLEGWLPPDVVERRAAAERERQQIGQWLRSFLGVPPKSDSLVWWQSGKNEGKRRYWRDISIEERMRLADMESWYGTIYRLMCTGIHAAGGIQSTYLQAEPKPSLRYGPNVGWAEMVLPYACQVLMLHLGVVGNIFAVESAPLIEAQRERLHTIHRMLRQE